MENIELGRESIDEDVMLSSDVETEESTVTELPTSIDTAQPEAGKSSLTELIDEEVVQTEPIGEELRLPLEDYLDPGRSYSNRSAIKIPGDDTKKSKFNADYYYQTSKTRKLAKAELRGSFCTDTFTITTLSSEIFELSPTPQSLTVFYFTINVPKSYIPEEKELNLKHL
ncbi:hypothetical protein F2Q68_00008411 [Brassica cretica]|uniref:Uncharacterized protein n=1 Tax=Brassica cretica TaxID=69181 RepID=A0A8S9L173_BRACR|nr:hypothetical protein F2Q68_00008411 [Brassica cretica]